MISAPFSNADLFVGFQRIPGKLLRYWDHRGGFAYRIGHHRSRSIGEVIADGTEKHKSSGRRTSGNDLDGYHDIGVNTLIAAGFNKSKMNPMDHQKGAE